MVTKKASDALFAATGERPKMDLYDRAKIFVPFDPLKGFQEALRRKELQIEQEAEREGAAAPRRTSVQM